jgi:hypothetical protein
VSGAGHQSSIQNNTKLFPLARLFEVLTMVPGVEGKTHPEDRGVFAPTGLLVFPIHA